MSRKFGSVRICSVGIPFGPSARGDLLLHRNLLVFYPYILVLKWREKIIGMPLCLTHFFLSLKRKGKKNMGEKAKVGVKRRRYFVAHSIDRKLGRGEIQRTRMYARLFLYVTLTRLRTSVLNRSPITRWFRHGNFSLLKKNSDALEMHAIRLTAKLHWRTIVVERDTTYFNEVINNGKYLMYQ